MTVTTQTRAVNYPGDGIQTIFTYGFLIPDVNSIFVQVFDSTTGLYTTLSSSDYTLTGVGVPSGGMLTYPTAGSPMPATQQIYISRVVPFTQELDIPPTGEFDSSTLESQLDKQTFMSQQNRDSSEGALRGPDGETYQQLPPKDDLKGKSLAFDATTGEPIAGPTSAQIAAAEGYAAAAAASAAAAGAPFETRAAAIAATIDPDVDTIALIHAGEVLRYLRDVSGTALTTNGGTVNWSPEGIKTVKHYGAVGDGVTDDTATVQAAFDDADLLILNEGGRYLTTTGVRHIDSDITAFGYGATIVQGGNIGALTYRSNVTDETVATSLDNIASIDVSNGAGVTSPVASVTFASHPFVVGDLVKVACDNTRENAGVAGDLWGEVGRVVSISATQIFLSKRFETDLPSPQTNIRVAKLGTHKMELHGLTFDTVDAGDAANWSSFLGLFQGLVQPILRDIKITRGWATALDFRGCVGVNADGIVGGNLSNDPSNNRFGYLVVDVSGTVNNWHGLNGTNCRHVFTTNQNSVTAGSDIREFGQTIGSQVVGGVATDSVASAWDTHHDAVGVEFIGCTAIAAVRGDTGFGSGYQIRGRDCAIRDCSSIGTKWGIQLLQQYATANAKDITIENFTHDGPDGALLVSGQSGFPITNINVRGLKGSNTDHDHLIEGSYCDMTLDGLQLKMTNALANVYPIAADAECTIEARNVRFDNTGLTGTFVYLYLVAEDTSKVLVWDNYVQGNWRGVFEHNGNDGTGITFTPMRGNLAPTNLGAVGTVGAGGVAGIDYEIDYGQVTSFNLLPLSVTSGNQTLSLGSRSCLKTFVRYEVTSGAAAVNVVDAGIYIGQEIVINNRDNSVANLTINDNPAGLLRMVTGGVVLAAGESATIWWDGAVWRAASAT